MFETRATDPAAPAGNLAGSHTFRAGCCKGTRLQNLVQASLARLSLGVQQRRRMPDGPQAATLLLSDQCTVRPQTRLSLCWEHGPDSCCLGLDSAPFMPGEGLARATAALVVGRASVEEEVGAGRALAQRAAVAEAGAHEGPRGLGGGGVEGAEGHAAWRLPGGWQAGHPTPGCCAPAQCLG